MHDFMDMEAVSLLMQEMIEYDYFLKTTKTNEFLTRSLEYPTSVLKQWKGRQSSRVWQIIVKRINEDGRQSLYHSILNGKLLELALDNCANFIVQEFIANANSEELAADIFDELLDNLVDIYEHKKWSVIKGLIQAAARHECHQSALLLRLRALFNSSKKSTKHAFLPNVFTLNAAEVVQGADGRVNFDISKGNLHGSLLLQDLLALKHNKTVVYSMLSLSKKTILELAHDQKGSYVLQAFIKSPFVNDEDKFPPAAFLKKKWWDLIDDNIASHVFDAIWDNGLFTIDEKQQIMMTLCDAQKQKKSSLQRIILRRLDARGFLENRNKWLQTEMKRMHNSKKATK
uniref:Pumilio 23 n=1 Tax=Ascaris suum TaxID=6253 RepID=F1L8Q3_ASCSU